MNSFEVREFRDGDGDGDEAALRAVFISDLHTFASRDYTPEQLGAW